MLTTGQCRVAAYLTDGDVVCVECGEKRLKLDREQMIENRLDQYEKEHGSAPTYWRQNRLEEEVDRLIQEEMNEQGLEPLIQYTLDSEESWQTDGLYCGDCGTELVEPQPVEDEDVEDDE